MTRHALSRRSSLVAFVLLFILALASGGCLGYPAAGAVATPVAPAQNSESRLPTLLQQLQANNGAGMELFDGSQSQVLAAQDAQGKVAPVDTATPTPVQTVAGTRTATAATPRPESSTATPRPGTATPTAATTATPAGTATASPTATTTATPTPSPTPTATPSGPPTEGAGPTPPHE